MKLSKFTQALTLLTCIPLVLGLKLDWVADCPDDIFVVFLNFSSQML
jgi:hypothetical protein